MYTSSIHVHLNKLQNQITLRSRVNDRTQETRRACNLIRARLIKITRFISCFSIIKKKRLLNVVIQKKIRLHFERRRFNLLTSTSINERIVIALHHKNQWNLCWNNYRKHVVDVNVTSTKRSHLIKKTVKMHERLQKIESTLTTHIRIELIDLKIYLHSRHVSSTSSSRCDCEWDRQTAKHVYRIIASITRDLKTTARMMMGTELLKQFRVTESLIL